MLVGAWGYMNPYTLLLEVETRAARLKVIFILSTCILFHSWVSQRNSHTKSQGTLYEDVNCT